MHQIRVWMVALLLLGAGLAQNTPQFSDVPAGHWAKEAVDYIAAQGLIQGFPDNTFRGNDTLTRYQAALIFFRLLQSGAMANLPAGGQTTVQRGMEEVAAELQTIQGRFDELQKTSTDQATRLQALEAEVGRLSQASAAQTPALPENLDTRLSTLEEQLSRLNSQPPAAAPALPENLSTRLTTLEEQVGRLSSAAAPTTPATPALPENLSTRLTTLEEQVNRLSTQPAPAPTTSPTLPENLNTRLTTLEEQVNQLRTQPATPPTPATPDADIEARISALEDQLEQATAQQPELPENLGTRITTLEEQLGRLAAQPAPTAPALPENLGTRLTTLEEQVTQLRAQPATPATPSDDIEARFTRLEEQVGRLTGQTPPALPENLGTRLTALEEQVGRLAAQPAPTTPALPENLGTRLTTLEERVNQIGTSPTDATARISALEEQVRTLGNRPDQAAQISTLQQEVQRLSSEIAQLRQPVTPPTPPAATTPIPTPPPARPNFFFGLNAALPIIPSGSGLNVGAMLGWRELLLGLGPRIGVEFGIASGTLSAEATLIRYFELGFLRPYLGLGARVLLPSGSTPIVLGNSAVGLDLAFGERFGLFVEANPRFEPGLVFGLGARAGLKLSF